jgi:hypothetical protein
MEAIEVPESSKEYAQDTLGWRSSRYTERTCSRCLGYICPIDTYHLLHPTRSSLGEYLVCFGLEPRQGSQGFEPNNHSIVCYLKDMLRLVSGSGGMLSRMSS